MDLRVQTSSFSAEQTLTRDTVPVDVEGVYYWVIFDPERAALEVRDYQRAVEWASQTALREVIGKSLLSDLLSERSAINVTLQKEIDARTEAWGTAVQPWNPGHHYSPGPARRYVPRSSGRKGASGPNYPGNGRNRNCREISTSRGRLPIALHLRAMNMLYEGMQDKGAIILVPSSALDTMNLGAMGGLSHLIRPEEAPSVGDTKSSSFSQNHDRRSNGNVRIGARRMGPI